LKNNNNSTRIAALSELFPTAVWVHITRDFVDTGVSLLEARRRFNVQVNEWWSAAPPPFWSEEFGDEIEQVAHQVVGVDGGIRDALAMAPARDVVSVTYDELCNSPGQLCVEVARRYRDKGIELQTTNAPPARFAPRRQPGWVAERDALVSALDRVRSRLMQ
jgi:hypothetical protein